MPCACGGVTHFILSWSLFEVLAVRKLDELVKTFFDLTSEKLLDQCMTEQLTKIAEYFEVVAGDKKIIKNLERI